MDEDVVAGHVVQDTLMFTNPIDSDEHTADKHTATYDENMESGIKVVIRVHPGNQRDPSERNKGTYLSLSTTRDPLTILTLLKVYLLFEMYIFQFTLEVMSTWEIVITFGMPLYKQKY